MSSFFDIQSKKNVKDHILTTYPSNHEQLSNKAMDKLNASTVCVEFTDCVKSTMSEI